MELYKKSYEELEKLLTEKYEFVNNEKVIALIKNRMSLNEDDIDSIMENGDYYTYFDEEYLILTDKEVDEKWEQEMDDFINDVVFPEILKHYRNYFDTEKYKKDLRMDERGHSLETCDSNKDYEKVNGNDYYIYRRN